MAKCFRLCKISLTQQEFGTIFAFFDRSGDGMISYREFVDSIQYAHVEFSPTSADFAAKHGHACVTGL